MTINDFTDKELADMIRRSVYVQNTRFDEDCRFLLVLAIPYGKDEGISTCNDAIEAFASFLQDDDWPERNFEIYDHEATEKFYSARYEDFDDEDDEEDDYDFNYKDDDDDDREVDV